MATVHALEDGSTPLTSIISDSSTTLLAFLTEENPPVQPLPTSSKDNSKSAAWHIQYPTLLKPWDDFTLSTFKTIYTGQLYEACIKTISPKPGVIMLDEVRPTASAEDAHRAVFRKCNWNRVNWALNHPLIKPRFNPALWRGKGLPVSHQTDWGNTPPYEAVRTSERNTSRPSTSYSEVGRKKVMLYPDDGAGRTFEETEFELVTMDYKVANKWNSEEMLDKCFDKGRLKSSRMLGTTLVRPIKQLFAYCISHGCRYGCLLTTQEAFLVRVGLVAETSGRSGPQTDGARVENTNEGIENSTNRKDLKKELVRNGLMEYISVPWTSHRDSEEEHDVEDWTINLALFFILVLAGNKHECDWTYGSLRDEKLRQRDDTPPRPNAAEERNEAENEPDKAAEKVASQQRGFTLRQPSPTTEDLAKTATVELGTPPVPVVRRSTRLKHIARSIPSGVGQGRKSRSTGKRQRSQPDFEAEDSRSSSKRKAKSTQDDYLISFSGSVDGLNYAQEALQVFMPLVLPRAENTLNHVPQANDTEGLGYTRDRSLSQDHTSET